MMKGERRKKKKLEEDRDYPGVTQSGIVALNSSTRTSSQSPRLFFNHKFHRNASKTIRDHVNCAYHLLLF